MIELSDLLRIIQEGKQEESNEEWCMRHQIDPESLLTVISSGLAVMRQYFSEGGVSPEAAFQYVLTDMFKFGWEAAIQYAPRRA